MEKVTMELDSPGEIPEFSLPEGYRILPFHTGDERYWLNIHLRADKYSKIDKQLHYRQFGDDQNVLRQRQFFIHYKDRVIGTASAWFNKKYKDGTFGQVHWVAIDPEHQGKGLAKPLLATVLRRLQELGYQKAMLFTDSRRPVAIMLYEKFGFVIVNCETAN
jgi:predicted GNAT family acetyltransferase